MTDQRIFQFKVELEGVKPPVWRSIQVPGDYSFWDLHVAIQDSMGWSDYHLHEFVIKNPSTNLFVKIGIPDEEVDPVDNDTLPGWEIPIAEYFSGTNPNAKYLYDFGDDWEHTVNLEKVFPAEGGISYPRCVDGKRACPPEDCGGPFGHESLLEALADPNHESNALMLDWINEGFDPEYFSAADVTFDDPEERWEIAFEE